jgi:hypothetical protein
MPKELASALHHFATQSMPSKLVAAVPPSDRQNEGELMKRILLLGLDPETVDYSDPALPPGITA